MAKPDPRQALLAELVTTILLADAHRPLLLTCSQAAKVSGIPEDRIRDLINTGILPAIAPSGERGTRVHIRHLVAHCDALAAEAERTAERQRRSLMEIAS